ncbi:beta-1,6-N-acetylglucosaminyltransferase [Xanthovirga aplysinae]|uniref:beta-1,6-N-acetylglucosaminyltransferase n=1 Tax=Xanthovirga aplysinae TaxID=2529853 RepID=UPI0012BC3995|nr:beta-1,6-N-acetylglucosaminyltransferase [Xanthovirga aplysinae]MTI30405.1 hypothetical protein [Xanthovirga aplysinae]
MDVNYIIIAHREPHLVKRLIERLQYPNNFFYIHIDGHVEIKPFIKELKDQNNVTILQNEWRVPTFWSDVTTIKATLKVFQRMLADHRSGFCVLLSGQDYPLRGNSAIEEFFKENHDINFIDGFSLPAKRGLWGWGKHRGMDRIQFYNYHFFHNQKSNLPIPSIHHLSFYNPRTLLKIITLYKNKPEDLPNLFKKRRFPTYLRPFGGATWWALPMKTVQKLYEFTLEHPDYLEYHVHTHVADEVFFQSIVHSLYPKEKIRDSITYTNWTHPTRPLPLTFEKQDFQELAHCKDKIFARKFSEETDAKILDLVDENLLMA